MSPPINNSTILAMPAETSPERRAVHVNESLYCLQVVRCKDLNCCSLWRRSHHNLLLDIFLPNPVPVKHSNDDCVMCDKESHTFLPLFINLQLNRQVQKEEMGTFVIPPYDLHCSSMQPHLIKRCFPVSCIYHASVKSAMNYVKVNQRSGSPTGVILKEKRMSSQSGCQTSREIMVILRDHLNKNQQSSLVTTRFGSPGTASS